MSTRSPWSVRTDLVTAIRHGGWRESSKMIRHGKSRTQRNREYGKSRHCNLRGEEPAFLQHGPGHQIAAGLKAQAKVQLAARKLHGKAGNGSAADCPNKCTLAPPAVPPLHSLLFASSACARIQPGREQRPCLQSAKPRCTVQMRCGMLRRLRKGRIHLPSLLRRGRRLSLANMVQAF